MDINDKTIDALRASLNFRQMRQKIIASNVANAETPSYKAKKVDFEQALQRALNLDEKQTLNVEDGRHYDVGGGGFDNLTPEIYEASDGVVKENGNTVDKEAEMAEMLDNNILYNASVQLLNKKLGLLKYAIAADK
ncbi:MAG: flagellar basal-body rod protein FlgB [Bdellovibrionales bacterium RIFOXYB1_FULL_37_110]|nr:MAG: flagellar basal-body rod protein FlgB [Bdellovibrionales bacterium RIFOXYA1_FULL_38_20]OFZ48383.1 MAG: flagellar basal-body rod protein FlgB [Bdellovibrionales bacterium RIFOXYC1_FULL_37_79]OFZ61052.1 MAG: flagellar basal-body rod protein FlgB [Bdellovibrionales bacterium RIFOXYB1_FULL_37_110]OFZ65177.1 MAG: flagellar basal-body rod protein FlgB [Bdellovibrionales bacterium RIFOXYD1_FULL_36_51]